MSSALQDRPRLADAAPPAPSWTWLPGLLGALVGVGLVKIALLTGATAGLEARFGWPLVAWGGKLGGLALGGTIGCLIGRARRARASDL